MNLPAAWRGQRVGTLRVPRAAVIGDIHGRHDLLLSLLDQLAPLDRCLLVAGDLCDRGPGTRRVIDTLIAHGAAGVLGNHDLWLLDWASGAALDPFALHPRMGGLATLASYGARPHEPHLVPRAHLDWLASLHLCIDLEVGGQRYWLTHAGVPVDRFPALPPAQVVPAIARAHPSDLLWRKNDPHTPRRVDRPVILGHWPVAEPIVDDTVVAIDTGAGTPRARLTALLLPERHTITVGA